MKVAVIGAGYLGTTHAICMASLGHEVIAVDVDEKRVELLHSGKLPFYEPGLLELLEKVRATGLIHFTTEFSAIAESELIFICVGTPQKQGALEADLSALDSAFAAAVNFISKGAVIVGKSTVPVGTAEKLAQSLHITSPGARLNWNPEFLREGHAIADTLAPNRIVIGADSVHDAKKLSDFYRDAAPDVPQFITNFPTAELVKVAANAFLATKISFINAMSEVADATGADVALLADAIGADDRIGRKFLGAGIGFGGGCLPKDIRAFLARGEELGLSDSLAFLKEFDLINQRTRTRAVALALEELGSVKGKKVAILGVAFKPESDDVRDSPALEIAQMLASLGANVFVHDPKALESAAAKAPDLHYCQSIEDLLRGADLTMHLTEWREYRELEPERLRSLVNTATIFDGRNALDSSAWRLAGWKVRALGRTL
ncbi:MAG: UDP-glucose/GDP-mannose dehydrogenase family protein [Actinobacteria bacterium]|nr:UDP-glucose/GDP-mannose dehydrogenase family protein [Actinomycetota bacterium]